jgi:hypothetical protein
MATYGEKYYAVFRDTPPTPTAPGEAALPYFLYRISLSFLNYTGTAKELEVYADEPFSVDLQESSASSVYQTLAPTSASINFRIADLATATSLYIKDDRQCFVELLCDTTGTGTQYRRSWAGWATPIDFTIKYGKFPTQVRMTATDGVATLKDRPLLDANGKRLEGNDAGLLSLSHMLRAGLNGLGYQTPITTGVNLYELTDLASGNLVNGKVDANRDPLYHTMMLASALVTDQNATQTSYDALKRLDAFGVRIGQASGHESEGDFYVTRVAEMGGGWDVHGTPDTIRTRRYNGTDPTSNIATGSSISRSLIVDVGPTLPVRVLKSGASTGAQTTKNGIRVEQSFGRQLSAIPNGDFSQVNAQDFPLYWAPQNLSNARREGTGNSEADPFRFTLFGNSNGNFGSATPMAGFSIKFSKLHPDFSKTFKRTFKCKFKCNEVKGASVAFIALSKGSWYILEAGGSWRKGYSAKNAKTILTEHFYTVNNVQKSKPGEGSVTLNMDGLSEVEEIQGWLCVGVALDRATTSQPYVSYYNLELNEEEVGLNLTGTQYTLKKPNTEPDQVASLTLGDVPEVVRPYSRTGALFRRQTGTVTTKWYRPDAQLPAQTAQGKTLLQIRAEEYAKQLLQPADTLTMTLWGRLPYGLFTVLRITDVLDENDQPIKFIITRWKWDTRRCRHEVTAQRIMANGALPAGFSATPEWQTPDGAIPMASDEAGNLFTPEANKQIQQLADQLKVLLPKLGVTLPGVAELPGHSPVEGGSLQIGARILQDGVVISEVQSVYRRDLAPDFLLDE